MIQKREMYKGIINYNIMVLIMFMNTNINNYNNINNRNIKIKIKMKNIETSYPPPTTKTFPFLTLPGKQLT